MSPVTAFALLGFAIGAIAHPSAQGHGHQHFHNSWASRSASASPLFSAGNSTGVLNGTGTGFVTGVSLTSSSSSSSSVGGIGIGTSTSSPPAVQTIIVSPLPQTGPASSVAAVQQAAGTGLLTTCTTDVTVTTTELTYVTVTAGAASASSSSSSRSTTTITVESTIYATGASSAAISSTSSATSVRTTTIHVNSTSYVTTITTGLTTSSTASVVSSSSTSSVSASSSVSAAENFPSYGVPSSYSAPASVWTSSSSPSSSVAAPATTSIPPSTSAAPTTTSTSSAAPSASSAKPASTGGCSSSPSFGGGKRGLAYNDASLLSAFTSSSHFGFAYNWVSNSGGYTPTNGVQYIPLLHSGDSEWTSTWSSDAQTAISNGAKYLFSFNEPDLSSQANMSPQDAASAWKQYMEPFAGKASLCAPSVTNGGGSMGLNWLSEFLTACSGCTIDCLNIHWYNPYDATDDFINHTSTAISMGNGKPVFVSEFAPTNGDDEQISGFLQTVMSWMDSNDDVAGYAYFMVSSGLLVSGSSPSSYGSTYLNYCNSTA